MMHSLAPYRLPMRPASDACLQAVARGVLRCAALPEVTSAQELLGGSSPPPDQVLRAQDGRVLITCTTDMPGVTPAMIDWWFGWHLPSSERYALWHPRAHKKATVREDRSHLTSDRAKYIGNVSYVDEYIGRSLKKLAIAFVPPADFALHGMAAQGATVICANTTDRVLRGQGGRLVHWVMPKAGGAQMRSGFWLGDIRHQMAVVDRLLHPLLNRPAMRQRIVSDRMALDLLQHCGEEMQHLASFLPRLHADMAPRPAAQA